jgi:hypothetical protein
MSKKTLNYSDGEYFGDIHKSSSGQIMRHGDGTFRFKNGQKYVGYYENDRAHGYGAWYFTNGDYMIGYYSNDLPHGPCSYVFANGDVFAGTYSNGIKHGKGTYTYSNGNKEEYKYVNDVVVSIKALPIMYSDSIV